MSSSAAPKYRQRKSEVVKVRLTTEQIDALYREALKRGESLSEIIRARLFVVVQKENPGS